MLSHAACLTAHEPCVQALQLSQILNANEEQTHRLRQLMRALQIEDEVRPARRRLGRCSSCDMQFMYKGVCIVCEATDSAQCVNALNS